MIADSRELTAFGCPLPVPADESLGEWPILALAASCWDEDRVQAFTALYKAMRRVDDLVDGRRKGRRSIPPAERRCLEREIRGSMLAAPDSAGGRFESGHAALGDAMRRFSLPDWPFERWTSAMIADLRCEGFESWRDFYRYSLGAAAAPGAIFLHLAAASREDGGYVPPAFDVDAVSRPLALFAYTVHLLRDFREDQPNGLNAFPRALLRRFGLDEAQLCEIACRAADGSRRPPARFLAFLRAYRGIAEHYRVGAREAIDSVSDILEPRARLSIEIVYDLYLQLLEKARDVAGVPDLAVTPSETRDRIARVIACTEAHVRSGCETGTDTWSISRVSF